MDNKFMNDWGLIIALVIITTIILTLVLANYFGVCKMKQQNPQIIIKEQTCDCSKKSQESVSVAIASNDSNTQRSDDPNSISVISSQSVSISTESNINNITSNNKEQIFKVTLYYADWCGHCKHFKPEWQLVKDNNPLNNLQFFEINCGENMKVCSASGVDGFPTVFLEKPNGSKVQYESYPRTAQSLVDFINKNMK